MLRCNTTEFLSQACCNMERANTCYSAGSSYCEAPLAQDFSQFSIRRSEALAACRYVISQKEAEGPRNTDRNTIESLPYCHRVMFIVISAAYLLMMRVSHSGFSLCDASSLKKNVIHYYYFYQPQSATYY